MDRGFPGPCHEATGNRELRKRMRCVLGSKCSHVAASLRMVQPEQRRRWYWLGYRGGHPVPVEKVRAEHWYPYSPEVSFHLSARAF